jgi:thioesterase domain-containing protein/aminoglycoside phosphotransferase (APT) family kinase protein
VVAFACGAALARVWVGFGCRPEVLIGDGLAGVVAAFVAGLLPLHEAVTLAGAGAVGDVSRGEEWAVGDVEVLDGRGAPLRRSALAEPAGWTEDGGDRVGAALGRGVGVVIDLATAGSVVRRGGVVVPGKPPVGSPAAGLVAALGAAWTAGLRVDWSGLFAADAAMVPGLPTYAFQRVRYWKTMPALAAAAVDDPTWSREEAELVKIWRDVFGAPGIDVHADFRELGGTSLLAAEVVRRAARVGIVLEARDLLQRPTIAELGDRLRSTPTAPASALVPLRRGGGEAPLFIASPLDGNVWYLRELADALRATLPVWVFDQSALARRGPQPGSIAELAEAYVDELLAVMPGLPAYRIAAYSFGCVVAVEMARQLALRGRRVERVLLLDGPALLRSWRIHRDGGKGLLWAFMRSLRMPVGRLEDVEAMAMDEILAAIRGFLAEQKMPLTGDNPLDFVADMLAIAEHNKVLALAWEPRPYVGDVTLLRSSDKFPSDLDLGWSTVVSGKVDIVPVPGDHLTMVLQPFVQTVATCLERELDRPPQQPVAEVAAAAAEEAPKPARDEADALAAAQAVVRGRIDADPEGSPWRVDLQHLGDYADRLARVQADEAARLRELLPAGAVPGDVSAGQLRDQVARAYADRLDDPRLRRALLAGLTDRLATLVPDWQAVLGLQAGGGDPAAAEAEAAYRRGDMGPRERPAFAQYDWQARLEVELGQRLGCEVQVRGARRPEQGFVNQVFEVDAVVGGAPRRLCLRADGPVMYGLLAKPAEREVLALVDELGVPCASPLALIPSPVGDGMALVTDWLAGSSSTREILFSPEFAGGRPALAQALARAMAKIHGVTRAQRPSLLPDDPQLLGGGLPAAMQMIASHDAPCSGFMDLELRAVHAWLVKHLPAEAEPRLVHGDLRMGNLLATPSGLGAVLDWETVHWGDTHRDLAWLSLPLFRFGRPTQAVAGLCGLNEFVRLYQGHGGPPVDAARLRWWHVYLCRWSVGLDGDWSDIETLGLTRPWARPMGFEALLMVAALRWIEDAG